MSRSLFLHIQSKVETYEPYFIQKRDNAQRLGLSSLQKIIAALRMIAYGVAADFMDEYVWIGESTAIESLKKFVKVVVDIFSKEYLRSLNNEDIARLLVNGESRGFPGMLRSIDCMHWKWKNFLTAWKVSTLVTFMSQPLFWKQSHNLIFGYGMHFLDYLGQIMILMY